MNIADWLQLSILIQFNSKIPLIICFSKDPSGRSENYSYSWSFLLSLVAFLGCEVSALLCFTAFKQQFGCHRDFLMIIPGMERKITEVQLKRLATHSGSCDNSSHSELIHNSYYRQSEMESKDECNSGAPVDLLKCSFMHCPSPSSSIDTLTSRHVPPPSQYTGTGIGTDDDTCGHVTTDLTLSHNCDHMLPVPCHKIISATQQTTLNGESLHNNILSDIVASHSAHVNPITSHINPISSHGQHVLLSAKLDPATEMSYDVTLSRLGTGDTMTLSRLDNGVSDGIGMSRLQNGNGTLYRDEKSVLATFPRNKKKVSIISSCNGSVTSTADATNSNSKAHQV